MLWKENDTDSCFKYITLTIVQRIYWRGIRKDAEDWLGQCWVILEFEDVCLDQDHGNGNGEKQPHLRGNVKADETR